jgi:hypothetical protein
VSQPATPPQPGDCASAWCVHPVKPYSSRDTVKCKLRQGRNSYRVEVEGLIQLYSLLPAHIHTRHACDNEAAVKAHLTSRSHTELDTRRWAAVEYRVTLDSLHQAISFRDGRPIQVIHTHSHMEGASTPDTDLHIRRLILAIADFQADKAHTLPTVQCEPSARELFTVHGPHGPLEKSVGYGTLKTLTTRRTLALDQLPMEGALLRAVPDRQQTAATVCGRVKCISG